MGINSNDVKAFFLQLHEARATFSYHDTVSNKLTDKFGLNSNAVIDLGKKQDTDTNEPSINYLKMLNVLGHIL